MDDDDKLLADNTNMYLERSLTCNLALWSTLAGIDGVFVSAASIVASLNNKATLWLLFGILVCCSISLLCLLLNFHSWRHYYRVLATKPPDNDSALIAYNQWLLEYKRQVPQCRRNCDYRENICYILLAVTVILFAVWIYTKLE